jgi:UDP-N-acetylmuramoyl-tripeptide--D-alanyl-D-alanine ligase
MEKMKPIPWATTDIIQATGGTLVCGDANRSFAGISIDSRTIAIDDFFVAIKGTNYDGHNFIPEVITKGIGGIILKEEKAAEFISSQWKEKGIVCVTVKETTRALGDLAAFNRRRSHVSVIAITGSNGKTTTREMTAAIVSQSFEILATSGNLNNEIGLPLTLLKLCPGHQWAVLELAMNHPGEIGRLAEICSPDIGVITNIGSAHLEGLGSIEGVMRAKGELLEKIKPEGTAVLNADDSNVLKLAKARRWNLVLFGKSDQADVRASAINENGLGTRFTLTSPLESIVVNLKIPGHFMVSNALAASTVGYALGFTAREIKTGLENTKTAQGRMNIHKTHGGVHIIDDTYNANPDSMTAALQTLIALKGNQRAVLVAGDMLELGAHSEHMHRKIGTLSAGLHISKIYFTGEFGEAVQAGARENGMALEDIYIGPKGNIVERLTDWLMPGDWVLVKGSRAMGMEKIVQALKHRYSN